MCMCRAGQSLLVHVFGEDVCEFHINKMKPQTEDDTKLGVEVCSMCFSYKAF